MREIKFRGKSKLVIEELEKLCVEHSDGWVYGNLVMYGKTPYIVGDFIEVDPEYTINEFWIPVIHESVGQYTGLKDKNGVEIYEGDVLEAEHKLKTQKFKRKYQVIFNEKGYWDAISLDDKPVRLCYAGFDKCEVIGNIYENKELLGG